MKTSILGAGRCILILAIFVMTVAHATDPASHETQVKAAWQAANQALVRGPQSIDLRDQAKLALPQGYGFVPRNEAAALMNAMGNITSDRFIGLIFPLTDAQWFVSLQYEPSGYIKDDDAKHWKTDELLQNLKDGTEQANKHREEMGIAPFVVTRWIQSPVYDAATHRLVWSAELRLKHGDDPDPGVNYNTYVLGREGYISLDLITSTSQVAADKPAADQLLAAVQFNEGKRYRDFNSSTDKMAAYGLAALIGGIAAKKLGLIALATGFFLKFAKLIAVAVVGAIAFVKRLFKRKQDPSLPPSAAQ